MSFFDLKCSSAFVLFVLFIDAEKLKQLEEKTGYSKVYFFFLISSVISAILFFAGGMRLISDIVSFLYPAYMSFKAIDSEDPTDDTQWLTYWVVFAFFSIVEGCAEFITLWIPFYFIIKCAFFVWLYHPKFLGAGLVYTQVIKPIVMPYVTVFLSSPSTVEKKVD